MDKGMVTKDNLKQLQLEDLYYLVTIPRPTFRNLTSFPGTLLGKIGRHLEIEATKETPDYQPVLNQFPYFTYHSPRAYFHQLEEKEKGVRYVLCFNPEKFVEERKQRTKKMAELENYFSTWNERLSRAQTTRTKSFIEKEVYAYLKKRKAVHLFLWKVQRTKKIVRRQPPAITLYRLWWRPNRKKLARLQLTDGLYCLKTNLPEQIPPATLVSSYRQRRKVEKAFHYLKAFVEIRPLYHRKEQRVQAHVTICILAYLLQVTVEYLLKKAGQPLSFPEFIEQLVTRRAVELEIRSLKKKQLKLPAIPREIAPLIQAVTPDLFTPAKDGLTNIRKSIL
jgi:transposase